MVNKNNDPIVAVTPNIVALLKKHQRRTGISAMMLLKKQDDVPQGLTTSQIMEWLNNYGPPARTKKSFIDYLIRCWKSEPDNKKRGPYKAPTTVLTKKLKDKIAYEVNRTGLIVSVLFKAHADEYCPEGLNLIAFRSWMSGNTKTIRTDYVTYALSLWERLPDKSDVCQDLADRNRKAKKESEKTIAEKVTTNLKESPPKKVVFNQEGKHLKFTSDMKTEIRSKIKQTGLTHSGLFADRQDYPNGFKWDKLSQYLRPNQKIILKEYYSYIIRVCDEHKDPYRVRYNNRLPAVKKSPPTPTRNIQNKPTIRTTYEDIRYNSYESISKNDLKKLRYYRDKYGLLPSKLLKDCQDTPRGLKVEMISSWLGGQTKRADPILLQWVLKRCREKERFKLI